MKLFFIGLVGVGLIAALLSFQPPTIGRIPLAQGEYFVTLLSCGIILVIMIFGGTSAIALAGRMMGLGRPIDSASNRDWFRLMILLLNGCLLLLFLYGRYIEPQWLLVKHYTLTSNTVSSPVRIVHLSDIHMDHRFHPSDQIVSKVNAVHPDIIIFTGDALNAYNQQQSFRSLMKRLKAKTGKFAVRGNWDIWYWNAIDLFKGTGFQEITSGGHSLSIDGNAFYLGGNAYSDNLAAKDLTPLLGSPNTYSIFLYHTPDFAVEASQLGYNLYLCGHTHGGQVAIPLYGALITLSRHGKRFERGLYQVKDMVLHVSPGIGVEAAIPLRILVRPEITVIDIVQRKS